MKSEHYEFEVSIGLRVREGPFRTYARAEVPPTDRDFDLQVDVMAHGPRQAGDLALVKALEEAAERARAMAAEPGEASGPSDG